MSLKVSTPEPQSGLATRPTRPAAPGFEDPPTTVPEGETIGGYEIGPVLGVGAMGVVYLATHEKLRRKVAIKVLRSKFAQDAEAVRRFFAEARVVNQVAHPNVIEITDFVEQVGGRNYFVMELLNGRDLKSRLEDGALPVPDAIHVAAQLTDALTAIHAEDVVHRDLKPENIFLVDRMNDPLFVKLLDFGVAKMNNSMVDGLEQTKAGALVGTPRYMSPEQLNGRSVTTASDVYSTGLVLYEMLTGEPAFPGQSLGQLAIMHMTLDAPAPSSVQPEVPDALDDLVLACLAKDPLERPPMDVVAARLAQLEQGELVDAAPLAPVATPAANPPRRWPLVAVGLAVVTLGAAAAGIALRSEDPAPPAAPPPPVASVEAHRLELSSEPPGAAVRRAGDPAVLGTTPLVLELSEGEHVLELSLEGHATTQHRVTLRGSTSERVSLAQLEPEEAPPATSTRRTRRPSAARPPTPTAQAPREVPKRVDKNKLVDPYGD